MCKTIILHRIDEQGNLVAEAFKYNLLRTKLNFNKNIKPSIVLKDQLIANYKNK